jgi:hypothetical protein
VINSKILHFCLRSLLKIDEHTDGHYCRSDKDINIDEEKHEAIFTLFLIVGQTLDRNHRDPSHLSIYFNRIATLSNGKTRNSCIRFMYKNLIKIHVRGWRWALDDIHIPLDATQHISE